MITHCQEISKRVLKQHPLHSAALNWLEIRKFVGNVVEFAVLMVEFFRGVFWEIVFWGLIAGFVVLFAEKYCGKKFYWEADFCSLPFESIFILLSGGKH